MKYWQSFSGIARQALFQPGRIRKRLHERLLTGPGEFHPGLFNGGVIHFVQGRVKRVVVLNERVVAGCVIAKQHCPAAVG